MGRLVEPLLFLAVCFFISAEVIAEWRRSAEGKIGALPEGREMRFIKILYCHRLETYHRFCVPVVLRRTRESLRDRAIR